MIGRISYNGTPKWSRTTDFMSVLVTRPGVDGETLLSLLEERGWVGLHEPLIFVTLHDGPDLDLQGVQALLATSSNGVRALLHRNAEVNIPVFAVGDATAKTAREAGFTQVHSASGDVSDLAVLVKDILDTDNGPLIHAAGTVQAGDLKETLEEAGFECRREVLYAADPAKSFSPAAIAAIKDGTVDTVLLYSPRTAETFAKLLRKARLVRTSKQLTVVCLSQAVAAKVADIGWKDLIVAKSPTQESLLDALATHLEPEATEPATEKEPDVQEDPPAESPPELPPAHMVAPIQQRKGHTFRTIVATLLFVAAVTGGGAATMDLWAPKLQEAVPFLNFGDSTEDQINELSGRLQKLESMSNENLPKLEELQAERNRLQSKLDVTLNRINTLESSIDTVKSMIAAVDTSKGPEAAEATLKKLAERLTRLEADGSSIASENQKRLGALAEQVAAIETQVPAATNADRGGTARAFLLAVGQLRTAVRAGRSFSGELNVLRSLDVKDAALTEAMNKLTQVAQQGVPSMTQLGEEFSRLAISIVQSDKLPKGDSLWDKTLARLARTLKWRRTDDLEGSDVEAVVARAERALKQSNLSLAVEELKALPEASASYAEQWLKNAEALMDINNVLNGLQVKAVALLAVKE